MTEHARLQANAKKYLELLGFLIIETHDARNRPVEKGIADILAIRRSWKERELPSYTFTLAIEFKIPPDKISAAQGEWLAKAREKGIMILVIKSLDELRKEVPY